MSAAAYYWPQTGRLEVLGTFPTRPSLLNRGQADGVGSRYVEMESRGELSTLGEEKVPVGPWLAQVMQHVEGQTIAALCIDRYKQDENGEGIDQASIRAKIGWCGMGRWEEGQ